MTIQPTEADIHAMRPSIHANDPTEADYAAADAEAQDIYEASPDPINPMEVYRLALARRIAAEREAEQHLMEGLATGILAYKRMWHEGQWHVIPIKPEDLYAHPPKEPTT